MPEVCYLERVLEKNPIIKFATHFLAPTARCFYAFEAGIFKFIKIKLRAVVFGRYQLCLFFFSSRSFFLEKNLLTDVESNGDTYMF